MYDKDVQYYLNFRQQELHAEAKQAHLVHLAHRGLPKSQTVIFALSSALKLSIAAFLVLKLAELLYA